MTNLSIVKHLPIRLRLQSLSTGPYRKSSLPYPPSILRPKITTRKTSTIAKYQGHLKVQRVRVRSRWLTWKKLGTLMLGSGLSFAIFTTILGALLDLDDADEVELVKEQLDEATKGDKIGVEDDEGLESAGRGRNVDASQNAENLDDSDDYIPEETPDGAWFIPLNLAKRLPQTYYNNSDPEWQAFVKFAGDKDKQQKVKNELCSMILKSLERNKVIQKALGKDIKCKSYWLDIDYPPGPPPEYERYGLEWADDYMALLYRPVSSTAVKRIEKALWPTAVTSSAFATLEEIFQIQYGKMKRALGFDNSSMRSSTNASQGAHKVDGRAIDGQRSTGSTKASIGNRQSNNDSSTVNLFSILPDYPQDDQQIKPGLALFRRKLSNKWKPALSMPPAGSIFLQGLVEYRGSTASCTVDVAAAYVLTGNKWHLVVVNVKRVQPNVQWPKGTSRRF